jgi:acyl-CoA dehydrogenase
MDALLRFVLDASRERPTTDQLPVWWEATAPARAAWTDPFDRALASGACADRLGYAFASGYAEALRVLVPSLPPGSISALCATEEAGVHPRAIKTRLAPTRPGHYLVSGRKKWGTVASAASSLLVVASTGEVAGKNQLRVVRVRAGAPGVQMTATHTAFVPEIPPAAVELTDVAVTDDDILPGDGYDDYLKPFRTIEDIHIHAALAGYLIAVARRAKLPHELQQRLLGLALLIRSLAHADPKAVTTHVALAGLLDLSQRLIGELEPLWSAAPNDEWTRWERDRTLLRVASAARTARRDRAWSILDGAAEPS